MLLIFTTNIILLLLLLQDYINTIVITMEGTAGVEASLGGAVGSAVGFLAGKTFAPFAPALNNVTGTDGAAEEDEACASSADASGPPPGLSCDGSHLLGWKCQAYHIWSPALCCTPGKQSGA